LACGAKEKAPSSDQAFRRFDKWIRISRMKKVGHIVVAIFEILTGLGGFVTVLGIFAGLGLAPYEAAPALWFGAFPIFSLIVGVMLLLHTGLSYILSKIVLTLQIPMLVVGGVNLLRLGYAANLYVHGTWLGSRGPTLIGVNFLAIAMLILLVWSNGAFDTAPKTEIVIPPPPVFPSETKEGSAE
jgi:hypothetical protein